MGYMGLKLAPVLVICLLGPLGLCEPIAGVSWIQHKNHRFFIFALP